MNIYQKIIEDQLSMNKISWQKLLQNGFTSEDKVRLDFWYYATNKKDAEALQTFLEAETDYVITVETSSDSMWNVKGQTQETKILPEVLDEWIEWMVIAGQESDCQFDGWGVQL